MHSWYEKKWALRVAHLRLLAASCLISGCASRNALQHTAIGLESDQLARILAPESAVAESAMAASVADTMSIAAFPKHIVDGHEQDYTIFSLAKPKYFAGIPSMMTPSVNSRTGAVTMNRTPETPARVDFSTSNLAFGVKGRIPIITKRHWLLFRKPCLYYFTAVHTGQSSVGDHTKMKLLDIVGGGPSAPWISMRPPELPRHLDHLRHSAVFIARSSYILGSVGAFVPAYFALEFDRDATRRLYRRLLTERSQGYDEWQEEDLQDMLSWLAAYPGYEKAAAYLADQRTPWFVGWDRENLVPAKRLDAAASHIRQALESDPNWDDARVMSEKIEGARVALAASVVGPGIEGDRAGLGLALRLMPSAHGYDGVAAGDRTFGSLAFFGRYQLQRDLSLALGSEALKVTSSADEVQSIAPSPGQVYLQLDYQTPLRIQMGSRGHRLQFTFGAVRLADELSLDGRTFRGIGAAWDIAVSLVPRQEYGYRGPESRCLNKSGLIELGFRSGSIGKYSAQGAEGGASLVASDGRTVTLRPQGLWLALNFDIVHF